MDRGGASFYYHTNELGSIVALTDSSGNAVEAYQYDAYGYQTVVLPGPNGVIEYGGDDDYLPGAKSSYGNPFLFTAQRYDASTGLMYYKNRYYSTYLGRFMSRDPIGIWGDPMELGNGYAYVGDNPATYADATGFGPGDPIDDVGVGLGKKPQPAPPPPPDPHDIWFIAPPGGPSSDNIIIVQDGWGWITAPGGLSSDNIIIIDQQGWITAPGRAGDLLMKTVDKAGPKLLDLSSFDIIITQDGWGWITAPGGTGGRGWMGGQDSWGCLAPPGGTGSGSGIVIIQDGWGYVTARKAGKDQQEYMKITLSDVLITAYNPSGSGGSDWTGGQDQWGMVEDYYDKMDEKGKSKGKVAAKWNVAQGAAAIAATGPGSGAGIIIGQDNWGCLAGSCRAGIIIGQDQWGWRTRSRGAGAGNNIIIGVDNWGI